MLDFPMSTLANSLLRFAFVSNIVILGVVISIVVYVKELKKSAYELALPPGPKGHWLFGSDIPKPYAPRVFARWAKRYGPVMSLRKGVTTYVIICGQQAAIDIMEKENAFLVDRPRSIAAGEVMLGNKGILLIGQGERFRKLRKALQSQLHVKIAEAYEPIQIRGARNVILDVLNKPERHIDHTRRYAASVIMSLTYGKQTPTSYSDPEVQAINQFMSLLGKALIPGAHWVDTYPIMRYIPGYLSAMRKYHEKVLALYRSQLDGVREQMRRNEAQPCFAKYLIERQSQLDLDDDELACLAGAMFGAGSDTTAAAVSIVIMAAALFPDAQRHVQEQLDIIVGRERMPSFGDMDALTSVTAFYLETYRWRPVSAGGFEHRATKNIVYGSYCIPKGATVIGNHWAIGKDPEFYPEPEQFVPSRWLTETGDINEKVRFFNFGFGRR